MDIGLQNKIREDWRIHWPTGELVGEIRFASVPDNSQVFCATGTVAFIIISSRKAPSRLARFFQIELTENIKVMHSKFRSVGDGCRPVSLKSMTIPATPRITVLAPHPDDFDAIGVTMQLFKTNGNHINVAVLTSGASGVENGFAGANTDEAKGLLREKEQQASVHFFGLPESELSFLHLSEDDQGHPENSTANRELIRRYLVSKNPQFIFLPHGNDTNPGHRLTHAFLRQIVDEEKLSVIAFLNRDPKTISIRQDLYTEFDTKASNWKSELLRFHQSQHQRNLNHRGHGFDERILQLNRQIAVELNNGDAFAEAFELEFFGSSVERRT